MNTQPAFPRAMEDPVDVIVIGAGPVGMALALELGLKGNRVTVIEKDPSRGPQPRAKTLNMRSLGHFRRWGVADDVRRISPTPADLPTDIVFSTRLLGKHIATLPNIYFRGNTRQDDPRFPEPSEWIPQYLVERVLKAKLDSLPNVTFRFSSELLRVEQDDAGVIATVLDESGREHALPAAFLVGADGARSRVRDAIGATLEGRHAFASHYNLVLRIPELDTNPPPVRGIMHWIINSEAPSVMSPMGEFWTLGTQLPEGADELSHEQIGRLLAATAGRKLDFEVVVSDRWYAHELIANRYRDRRIFLAGDACHLHPPFGGYGMNMGIADAVDLGWKIDAVLHGWGGETLLDSYEWERKRVHRWTIDEAVENYRHLVRDLLKPGLEDDGEEGYRIRAELGEWILEVKQREFHTIGVVLGGHYRGSPVIAGGRVCDAPPQPMEYVPSAEPGVLAPHLWLAPGESLYDRFGPGMTLLDTGGDREARARLVRAATAAAIPLSVVEIDDARAAELYGKSLCLIRPDEYVAWCGSVPDDAAAAAVFATISGKHDRQPRSGEPQA